MTLADHFNYGQRLASVQRQWQAGLVIKLYCDLITNPAEKRLVVVAPHRPAPHFFIINTRPTPHAMSRPRLASQQLAVSHANNYLDHDSWIDCSAPYTEWDMAEIEQALANDMSRILGNITKETAGQIIDMIADSETLSPHEINEISMELSTLV